MYVSLVCVNFLILHALTAEPIFCWNSEIQYYCLVKSKATGLFKIHKSILVKVSQKKLKFKLCKRKNK